MFGHTLRQDRENALTWAPERKRKKGRPKTTRKKDCGEGERRSRVENMGRGVIGGGAHFYSVDCPRWSEGSDVQNLRFISLETRSARATISEGRYGQREVAKLCKGPMSHEARYMRRNK